MRKQAQKNALQPIPQKHEVREGQSIELLKELHILTVDGKLNQDSRRKLKQIYHLFQFIEPLLQEVHTRQGSVNLVDHGAGKSYLGFILYDLFFKNLNDASHIFSVELREELVEKSQQLAKKLNFLKMSFLALEIAKSATSPLLDVNCDIVTALHACDTATDDVIRFALQKQAQYIILIPCCQAEIAALLRKKVTLNNPWLGELWRHPIHAREFGSHLTNVLRCLWLESKGYSVTTTELIGFEHSMKNELIIAKNKHKPNEKAAARLDTILTEFGLTELKARFI